LKLNGDRAGAAGVGHAARQIGAACRRRRRRLKRDAHLHELRREALELCDAFGDLDLLVRDQLRDSLVRGPAVGAIPNRQQLREI
jgi:hypothetical protein